MGTRIHMIKRVEANWLLMVNGIISFLCFCFFWVFTDDIYINEANNIEAFAVILAIFCFVVFLVSIIWFLCSIKTFYIECKCNKLNPVKE